jgi:hypothetical protein
MLADEFNKARADQIDAFKRRVGAEAKEDDFLDDLYSDALVAVEAYTGRTERELNHVLMVAAKRYAIVLYNQQDDEGETERIEGGVTRQFESGIPSSIRSVIAPYRLARTRTMR